MRVLTLLTALPTAITALSSIAGKSGFHGSPVQHATYESSSTLEMRKQKASDRRTRRAQRGDMLTTDAFVTPASITSSPMNGKSWNHKQTVQPLQPQQTGGRGRSRKRSALYNSLSLYHNKFLRLLTEEYKQEVRHGHCFYLKIRARFAHQKYLSPLLLAL